MDNSIAWIPVLPLIGFAVNILFGVRLKAASAWIAVAAMAGAFALSVGAFSAVVGGEGPITTKLFSWMVAGRLSVDMGFLVDECSAIMLMVVTFVGSLIHVYSIGYMHGDPRYSRFFAYLNLFAAMMLILVLGDNYLVMFMGWEGVGLCSYLLIGFWFEKPFEGATTREAARKAFVVNRIGDFGFLIAILLVWTTVGTLNFQAVMSQSEAMTGVATAVTLLLLLGATGKSAQIPLFVWLPDAMAGPTPVSALIHAATMVTAGVYMIARNAFLFDIAPISASAVVWIGAGTAFFAATIGLIQNDIKKVLAYSTISQLGYMFIAVGAGAYAFGLFHLVTHAFFKALLFLGAGAVIHALHDEQDITKMGGLRKKLPVVYWTFVIGAAALSGIPFTAGFFSKDGILAMTFASGNYGPWALGVLGAGMTAFYTWRLVFLTFHGEPRSEMAKSGDLHVPGLVMTIPLMILAAGSILTGYVELPFHMSTWFSHLIGESAPLRTGLEHPSASVETILMAISIAMVATGVVLAWKKYGAPSSEAIEATVSKQPAGISKVLWDKWYVDEVYNAAVVRPVVWSAQKCWRIFDDWVIHNGLVVFGGGLLWKSVGFFLSFWQTGKTGSYAFALVVGTAFLVWLVL